MSEPIVPVFRRIDPAIRFPEIEQQIIEFWRREKIFERTLLRPSPRGSFVFYEGPPTANGTPHNGHVLTRVVKDLFPRYRSMRGYHVERKAGWDTHGLPVEVEVEKELRIHGKAAIEAFGVEPFVRRCIDSVFRYTNEWERLTERIGFWCDLKDAYVTYHRSYVESVWWALSQLLKKGLLYRGHKVVWWWAQGGTALSAAEVGLGYKTVDDPSAFVRFPMIDLPQGAPPGLALAVWTTTPWTLPSNMYAAVKADARYVIVDTAQGPVLVAEALAEVLVAKLNGRPAATEKAAIRPDFMLSGYELAGLRYTPPFDLYARNAASLVAHNGEAKYWRVLVEDFVTLDAGTGVVHVAPAFGEDDNRAFKRLEGRLGESLELFCAVFPDGTFKPELATYAGRWVKDADKDILSELKGRGLLLFQEQYRHDYPFCWRADDDPLIQFARPAWFIRTTSHKADALANSAAVQWLPSHIKEGRFGDFLANNVDWALSRERFWGTPLNVWVCEKNEEHLHAPTSVDELIERNPAAFDHFHAAARLDPNLNPHLMVHKPWIDQVTFPCKTCGATARRVPEVIDCWFDSGCMPFAQWGFPHLPGSAERVRALWPADFISEAIDQTRGWFYSLLMISTLVFDPETRANFALENTSKAHPYRTCIVLGHVCDREGKKESKGKGNYTSPDVILDRVRMEFAVVDGETAGIAAANPGECFIAREDLEGLDLQEGATMHVYRGDLLRDAHVETFSGGGVTEDDPRDGEEDEPPTQRMPADANMDPVTLRRHASPTVDLAVRVGKGLPRRVVVLHPADRAAVSAVLHPRGLDIKPVEVPRLPPSERVYLEDRTSPAPGADAFRWFFYASSPPWTNTRHSLSNVRASQKDFAIKLRNVFSFFTIYAGYDGFDPRRHERRAIQSLPAALDRWMLSELAIATRDVISHMDEYRSYEAAQVLLTLVESLSNWYVRRSRARFWAAGTPDSVPDKRDAYGTLYEVLLGIAKLSAPFVPFLAEELYRVLAGELDSQAAPSVHLCDYPTVDAQAIDETLSREMEVARAVVSLGLQVRTAAKLKVRQPLALATVVVAPDLIEALRRNEEVIREELNVRALTLIPPEHAAEYVTFRLKPNFRALGPRLGKEVQTVKKALEQTDAGALRAALGRSGKAIVPGVEIDGKPLEVTVADIEVAVAAREGFAAAGDKVGVVVLDTRITKDLRNDGLARELLNRLQTLRKELGLEFDQRVTVRVSAPRELIDAVDAHGAHIAQEALCTNLEFVDADATPLVRAGGREIEIDGHAVLVWIAVISPSS